MKRFKTKKTKHNKYILLFILSFILMIYIVKDNIVNKGTLINKILDETTNKSNLLNNIKNRITTPKYMLYDSLNKVVDTNSLSVFSNNKIDDFNYNDSKSEYVIDPNPTNINEPLVYLYNTHQLEEYNIENVYDYSVKPNVLIASYILKEKLNNKGIKTIVETNNIKEYLNNNNLSYNMSYHASEYFARLKLKENPSIKYLIDIHRDSARYNTTFINIDGIPYAKIMILSGYEHTLKENNIGFAESLNNLVDKMYPGLSRGVVINDSEPVNGTYNPNLNGKSVLIEVGGVDNKLEEVNNTMEALSNVIKSFIEGEL